MPRAYAVDLRERALRALDAGLAAGEIERTFGISARSLRRWRQRVVGGQPLVPGTSPGRPPVIAPTQHDLLRAQVAAHPDATLAQHCALWQAATQGVVSVATMARTLTDLGLTLQKSPHGGRTRCAGPDRVVGRRADLGPGRLDLRR
jgi:transposase